MDKVVIFARVSTDRQEYLRQLIELREYCVKAGWQVVREFANKVSGAKQNDERPEIEALIDFVKENQIRRVVCLEIAQMERLTIRERMASGRNQYIAKCRAEGIKMGRPVSYRKSEMAYKEQYGREISLLKKGISLRNVASITGTSVNTLRKIRDYFCDRA